MMRKSKKFILFQFKSHLPGKIYIYVHIRLRSRFHTKTPEIWDENSLESNISEKKMNQIGYRLEMKSITWTPTHVFTLLMVDN